MINTIHHLTIENEYVTFFEAKLKEARVEFTKEGSLSNSISHSENRTSDFKADRFVLYRIVNCNANLLFNIGIEIGKAKTEI